jgi:hypothetical protein
VPIQMFYCYSFQTHIFSQANNSGVGAFLNITLTPGLVVSMKCSTLTFVRDILLKQLKYAACCANGQRI